MSGARTAAAKLTRFVDLLRTVGLRVSSAEVLDAGAALTVLPWDDRAAVKAGLAAVLVKHAADRGLFSEVFDAHFEMLAAGVEPRHPGAASGAEDGERGSDLLAALATEAATLGPVAEFLASGEAGGLAAVVESAAAQVGLGGPLSPLQQGLMAYRLVDALGVDGAVAQILALPAAAATAEGEAPDWLRALLAARARTLRELARTVTRAAFRARRPTALRSPVASALVDRPFAQMSEAESRVLEAEVQRFGRRLAGRLALVRRTPRRRTLDLHGTLRRSLATGGVPMSLAWRRRPPKKPRLVVLCDVSDSVRNASRFMLRLAHSMAKRFDRVVTFAFVSEIGEVSRLFASCDANEALRRIFAGEALNVFSSSNYGQVLEEFWSRHQGLVTSRTTVIILGDGRTNDHPHRADLLARIAARAKVVYWLNPENPALWGFGDSAMRAYLPIVDAAHCVANLSSLGRFIDDLHRPSSS